MSTEENQKSGHFNLQSTTFRFYPCGDENSIALSTNCLLTPNSKAVLRLLKPSFITAFRILKYLSTLYTPSIS